MTDPRPVDSEGQIYFNFSSHNSQVGEDTLPAEMSDHDDEPIRVREDIGVNTSYTQSSAPEKKNDELGNVLSGITSVLQSMTREMHSMKQTIETQNTYRADSNQNNRGNMPQGSRSEVMGMRPCPADRSAIHPDSRNRHAEGSLYPDHMYPAPSYSSQYDIDNYQVPTVRDQIRGSNRPRQVHDGFNIKIPPFTGKEEWPVWIARFETIAQRFGWSEEDKLDHLLPRMEGQAGQFVFAQLPPRTLRDYKELISELHSRFRVIETARSFAAKFSKRVQRSNETAEDYAADLKVLYDKAHGYRDKRTREEDLVRRFLDGLREDEIRFEVEYHKEPETLDEAVYHVVNLIQTRNVRERKRDHMRRAADGNDLGYESESLHRVQGQGHEPTEDTNDGKKANPAAASEVKQVTDLVHQLLHLVQKLTDDRSPVAETERSKVKPERRNIECFNCHKLGHIARECPEKKALPRNYSRQSQVRGYGQGEQKNLNFTGPALAARGRPN